MDLVVIFSGFIKFLVGFQWFYDICLLVWWTCLWVYRVYGRCLVVLWCFFVDLMAFLGGFVDQDMHLWCVCGV